KEIAARSLPITHEKEDCQECKNSPGEALRNTSVRIPSNLEILTCADDRKGPGMEEKGSNNSDLSASSDDIRESSDYKSGGTYGEFEYKSEKVKEEEGYYTGERSGEKITEQESVVKETTGREEASSLEVEINEMEIPIPAIYLTVLKEVSTLEEEK
ncbi:15679_t:CDS:2, partial [Acaulospora morrowiae]